MEVQGVSKHLKRKSRSSSSDTDKTSPKRNRAESSSGFENSPTAITELSGIDDSSEDSKVVDETLKMVEAFGAKLDQLLSKLDILESRVNDIHRDLSEINVKLSELDNRVSLAERKTMDLEEAIEYGCKDTKESKEKVETESYLEAKEEAMKLKLHLLNKKVYQRRENLRFYGIEERSNQTKRETQKRY